mgnify:CR=1 FL=1
MNMKVKVCVLQFERASNFKKNVEKVKSYLESANSPDFALIGGESLHMINWYNIYMRRTK